MNKKVPGRYVVSSWEQL
ncbi:BnaA08g15150D [Brassica napus]|uniref:BnaA08g15150D protein n=4 Tax=Brassica TaxID=3705 RepID=A0A078GE15_BRANA|nr:BnaA08g15150D [Brassica napus]